MLMIILLLELFIRWQYLPGSYDNLDFSWAEFFWFVTPIVLFVLIWQFVIDKQLKKWEDKKKNKHD